MPQATPTPRPLGAALAAQPNFAAAALSVRIMRASARFFSRNSTGSMPAFAATTCAARAIVSDPQLLVCDEPTGDLDRKTADEILRLLQALNQQHGKTIVMVTHDPKAAEYAKRILHLEKGQLLEQVTAVA